MEVCDEAILSQSWFLIVVVDGFIQGGEDGSLKINPDAKSYSRGDLFAWLGGRGEKQRETLRSFG